MTTKTMVQKFNDGDALSDDELDQLIYLYTSLEFGLKLLGTHFHLAWKEVMHNLERLNSFKEARQADKRLKLRK